MKIRGPIRGMQGSFEYAALHAEGAGDGGEDGDDEVDDGLDVLFFHCCDGFDGYTILWWGDGTQACGGMMVTQSGEKGYGGSEQVPVHDGVSLVLAGGITPVVSWCDQPGWSSEYPGLQGRSISCRFSLSIV